MSNSNRVYSHSSYGLISFSRFRGDTNFFGVEPTLNGGVTLRINRCEVAHNLNQDWYHGKERLIEVNLSAHQFAELITSLNMREGVPCTIKHVIGQKIEPYTPMPSIREQFDVSLSEKLKTVENRLGSLQQEIETLKAKGKAGKKDLEALSNRAANLLQDVHSEMPFIAKCFSEQMDEQVLRSKVEFTAYIDRHVYTQGLRQIGLTPELPASSDSWNVDTTEFQQQIGLNSSDSKDDTIEG